MDNLARTTPVLRRRALYHAGLFASFSLFWTTTPLLLASSEFGLPQGGIALFALAGCRCCRSADCRPTRRPWLEPSGSDQALGLLVGAAILLDFWLAAHMTLAQRAIFELGAELPARLNGLYMTTFFVGGAVGSALGGWAYARGGWMIASMIGIVFPASALAYFMTECRH